MILDFSNVGDVESFVSVPEGRHLVRIAEVREGRARDGSVRWCFRLEVCDPDSPHCGRTAAWDSITWSARGMYRAKKLLEAFGLDCSGELELSSNDLFHLRAVVNCEPEESEDPITGRRQVRMRVPYLGYTRWDEKRFNERRDALLSKISAILGDFDSAPTNAEINAIIEAVREHDRGV